MNEKEKKWAVVMVDETIMPCASSYSYEDLDLSCHQSRIGDLVEVWKEGSMWDSDSYIYYEYELWIL